MCASFCMSFHLSWVYRGFDTVASYSNCMFNWIRNCQTLPKQLHNSTLLPALHEGSDSSAWPPTLAILVGGKWHLFVLLICIYQVTNEWQTSFHVLAGHLISLWRSAYSSLSPIFKLGHLSFLSLSCKSSLIYSEFQSLIRHRISNIFSPSAWLPFQELDGGLRNMKVLNFDGVQFVFFCCGHAFGVPSKGRPPDPSTWRSTPVFSSKRSAFPLRYSIYMELIFTCDVREVPNVILLHMSQQHLLKILSVLNYLSTLVKNQFINMNIYFGMLLSLQWSLGPPLCQYHTVLTTAPL